MATKKHLPQSCNGCNEKTSQRKDYETEMVAVITGASSGIGKETARIFNENGWQVVCLSRTPCDINGVKSIRCDITKQEDIDAAFAQISRIDLLINNAGFGVSSCAEFMDMSEIRSQFELNFFAHTAITQAALPFLRKSKGRIIFTSSAAAVFSIPFQSFYSASKAAIESFACALSNELKAFGITVCAVRLGDVKTGFTAARKKDFAGDDIYGGIISKSVSVMENDEIHGMSPETIAAAVFKAAKRKKPPVIITVGAKYKLFCLLAKILPQNTVNKTVGSMYMPK